MPTSSVPPADMNWKVRVERSVWANASASCSVPPANTRLPVVPPMLSSVEIRRMPSLIVVCFVGPPPATLVAVSTRVPRPDFVRFALVDSGESMIAVSFGEMAVEVGLTTVMTYSVAPRAPVPSSARPLKPLRRVELAEEGVANGLSVKRIAPALTLSEPLPLTVKSEAVEVLLWRTRALMPPDERPVRSPMSDSRMFQVVEDGAFACFWAKVPYS